VGTALTFAGVPTSDRVMSIDASGYRYWTGHPGVVLVNDPLATVSDVANAYDIRWLVVEPSDSVSSVTPLKSQANRPWWVGPPLLDRPDVTVYPICHDVSDPRCLEPDDQ